MMDDENTLSSPSSDTTYDAYEGTLSTQPQLTAPVVS